MFSLPPFLRWLLLLSSPSLSTPNNLTTTAPSVCKLPANQSIYLSAGFGYELDCAPSAGTLRGHFIAIDFPDAAANESSPQALYDFFLPAAGDFFATVSYGVLGLDVGADVSKFYRMPAASTTYGFDRGISSETHYKYIQDALDAYSAGGGEAIEPTDVLYVAATKNAPAITFSPTYMGSVAPRDGPAVAKKSVTFGADAYARWGFKVLNHETGHTMCLPDLYPFNGSATGLFVGGWDVEGLISGPAPDYFAWDKWRLGWLEDESVSCLDATEKGSSEQTLSPLEVKGGEGEGVKAVVVKLSEQDVLVAELRTAAGVDQDICAPGVLLYTVSTQTHTGEGPVRVLNANPGGAGCAGDVLNGAPLSMDGARSYTDTQWGVTVTLINDTSIQVVVE